MQHIRKEFLSLRVNILPSFDREQELLENYNQAVNKINSAFGLNPEDKIPTCDSISDIICPYFTISQDVYPDMKIWDADNHDVDTTGIYFVALNEEGNIRQLTDYEIIPKDETDARKLFDEYRQMSVEDRPMILPVYLSAPWHGMCDNSTQALKYLQCMEPEIKSYLNTHPYIILISPVFRNTESEAMDLTPFGPYIGRYPYVFENIENAKELDYIFIWRLFEVRKKNV